MSSSQVFSRFGNWAWRNLACELFAPYSFLPFFCSSGSKIRSFFISMELLPSLVDKVVKEKGMSCINVNSVLFCHIVTKGVDVGGG